MLRCRPVVDLELVTPKPIEIILTLKSTSVARVVRVIKKLST